MRVCVCVCVCVCIQDAASALFGSVSKAIESAPDALDPYQVAALFEAAAGSGVALSEQVGQL